MRIRVQTGPHTHAYRTVGGRQQRQGVDLVPCPECPGNVRLKVPSSLPLPNAMLVSSAQVTASEARPAEWAVGVTTVPERIASGLTLRTLASLRSAGFPSPRLFVDGFQDDGETFFNLPDVNGWTRRWPAVKTVGNWILSAWELLIRNPTAGRFAILQDDVLLARNVRTYLDACPWPERGYLNLHCFGPNELAIKDKPAGWHRGVSAGQAGNESLQKGYGATALCFTREGLSAVLASFHIARKVSDVRLDKRGGGWTYGQVRIDGAVVTAANLAGWTEHVHQPSLAEHMGDASSMGGQRYRPSGTFRGESFDALELLKNLGIGP